MKGPILSLQVLCRTPKRRRCHDMKEDSVSLIAFRSIVVGFESIVLMDTFRSIDDVSESSRKRGLRTKIQICNHPRRTTIDWH